MDKIKTGTGVALLLRLARFKRQSRKERFEVPAHIKRLAEKHCNWRFS